jgi:peptide-methionine (S)-S-oxide reductase
MNEIAVFGGGCFWCTEAIFKGLKGVVLVMPGYSGGAIENPTYAQVSTGDTGHAEVIKIEFDPSVIAYRDLVEVFMYTHDPTTLNRQGNDVGTQYRSVIFYTDEKQKQTAEEVLEELRKEKTVVTELSAFEKFYEAEDYHRDYYERNQNQPYCQVVISPKLQKLREKYSKYLK